MNLLISILYYFRQATKIFGNGGVENLLAGNIDPFYLTAPAYFYENYNKKQKMKKLLIFIIPIISLGIVQYIFNDNLYNN